MLKILKKREETPEKQEETQETAPPVVEQIEAQETIAEAPVENSQEAEKPKEEEHPQGITSEFREEAESFAKGKDMPAERLEAGMAMLKKIGEAWRDGALTVEMLEVALRGIDYDDAVAKAFAEGELKGRNTQIEEKYMRPEDSDGLPHPQGKGSAARSGRRVASIFDLARDAG